MKKRKRKNRNILIISIGIIFFHIACSQQYKLRKSLPHKDKEFLSVARYIITKQEKKIFLNISDNEREQFKIDFWKKRDPEPETERNIYKETYLSRIEESNRLFTSGGRNGWLSDRGRVYIMLGPPHNRQVYPMGYSFYEPPVEIWYYGYFPVLFVDKHRTGSYDLVPLSNYHMIELTKAGMVLNQNDIKEKLIFDFKFKMDKLKNGKTLFQVSIPYKVISFKAEDEGKKFQTSINLFIEIFKIENKRVWNFEKSYLISITKEDLDKLEKYYLIKELLDINLAPGNYTLKLKLENSYDKKKAKKTLKMKIK
jgi:GWxTD domain-containing protein